MRQDQGTTAPGANAESARDLLLRLYRDIGISAVAAAVQVARYPSPEDLKTVGTRDIPAILRDHDIAA